MIEFIPYFIGFAYLTLGIELVFFPVKSPGSTYRILKGKKTGLLGSILALSSNLLIVGIMSYPLSNLFFNWHSLSTSTWIVIIGMILIVLGRAISFGAMIQLRKNQQRLHNTGFFKWTRNPNIDGTITFLIGMWVLMPNTIYFIGSILVFIYLKNRAKMEEKYLIEAFGEKYLDYKKETPSSIYL